MLGRAGRTGGYAGLLLAVPALLALGSGFPFVFPSLGPTAYLMAVVPESDAVTPRRVVGGHLVGAAAGLVAYHLLAPGLVVTASSPALGPAQARLAASAVASVGLTAAGMRATGTEHPPACATTLIVSLGLLSSLVEVGVVVVAVVVLAATHRWLGRRLRAPSA